MSEAFNLITIAQSNDTANGIDTVAKSIGGLTSEVRHRRNGTPILDVLSDSDSDILLVELDLSDDGAIRELERIVQNRGGNAATLVTSPNASIQDIRSLLRLGIQDFIPQPISKDDLVTTLKETISQLGKAQSSGGASNGKVITFLRACGGAGATALSVELAAALNGKAQGKTSDRNIGILDLDLQYGNVDLSLDLVPTSTILDVMESGSRLDTSFLQATMTAHHSGIQVLTSPKQIYPLDAMTSATAVSTISVARKIFDFTIIDMPHAWTNWTQPVLGESDLIFLVMQPNVTAVHRTQKTLDAIDNLDLDKVPLVLIANKVDGGMTARQRISEASEALKRDIPISIRADYKDMEEARNRGVTLADVNDRSHTLKDIEQLIPVIQSQLSVELTELSGPSSGPLFSRFRRK